MKKFNTTGVCIPSMHYMVDLSERVALIKKKVDAGEYFTINRGRQYGKTTTIDALEISLSGDYHVLSLDFQKISDASFKTEENFVKAFCRQAVKKKTKAAIPDETEDALREIIARKEQLALMDELFDIFDDWCSDSEKPIVLIVDEVDSATNNQVFLDFLAQLRADYLEQKKDPEEKTFKSVILAGVTDIRYIKRKIRPEEEHRVNSPWNIASDFDIDMSLSEAGIKGMLDEYEGDHHTGMETADIAHELREYTNGYPFLVSRLCQLMDEYAAEKTGDRSEAWTKQGLQEAIKQLLSENNTLFQSITGKLNNYPELNATIKALLMEGEKVVYNAQQESIQQLHMYGLIRKERNLVRISNRIFETMLYNLFLSDEELKSSQRLSGLFRSHHGIYAELQLQQEQGNRSEAGSYRGETSL